MKFEDACKIAYEYYEIAWNCSGFSGIKDLGDRWLFYPKTNEPYFGDSPISVNKLDGNIEQFILPDEENFKSLDNSIILAVPENYN